MQANPDSDEVKFDLADAYFRKGLYDQALEAASNVSAAGRQDASFLSLLGDIYAHLGNTAKAEEIFRDAISRNPDNDQYYLSLTLVQLRNKDVNGAEETLQKGLARIPSSGKILWGLGIVSALQGKTAASRGNDWNAQWIFCPNGPVVTPRWASSIIRPDKSPKLAKC